MLNIFVAKRLYLALKDFYFLVIYISKRLFFADLSAILRQNTLAAEILCDYLIIEERYGATTFIQLDITFYLTNNITFIQYRNLKG